jgi:hypothetical protein
MKKQITINSMPITTALGKTFLFGDWHMPLKDMEYSSYFQRLNQSSPGHLIQQMKLYNQFSQVINKKQQD